MSTYVWRSTSNFIDDFIDSSTGVTSIPVVGTVANRVYDNTDEPRRDYQALIFQSDYRVRAAVMVGGHYTLQLRNHGNFVGESAGRPIPDSVFGNYPEISDRRSIGCCPKDGSTTTSTSPRLRRLYELVGPVRSPRPRTDLARELGTVYSHTATLPLTAVSSRAIRYPTVNINPAVRQTIFFASGAKQLQGLRRRRFRGDVYGSMCEPWPRG